MSEQSQHTEEVAQSVSEDGRQPPAIARHRSPLAWDLSDEEMPFDFDIQLDTGRSTKQKSKYQGPSRFTDHLGAREVDYHRQLFTLVFKSIAIQYSTEALLRKEARRQEEIAGGGKRKPQPSLAGQIRNEDSSLQVSSVAFSKDGSIDQGTSLDQAGESMSMRADFLEAEAPLVQKRQASIRVDSSTFDNVIKEQQIISEIKNLAQVRRYTPLIHAGPFGPEEDSDGKLCSQPGDDLLTKGFQGIEKQKTKVSEQPVQDEDISPTFDPAIRHSASDQSNLPWGSSPKPQEECDFSVMKTQEIIDLVAHYLVNHTMKFFAESKTIPLATAAFQETEFKSAVPTGLDSITQSLQNQYNLRAPERRRPGIFGGCFGFCMAQEEEFHQRSSLLERESTKTARPHPVVVSKFIGAILTSLKVSAKASKTVCILMLVYIERLIVQSQKFKLNKFKTKVLSDEEVEGLCLPFDAANPFGLFRCLQDYELSEPQIQMLPTTWKPLVYTGLLIATKYWEDRYFWNIDAVNATGVFEVDEVNSYEHLFLEVLDFKMVVDCSTFESYFRWLQTYSEMIG